MEEKARRTVVRSEIHNLVRIGINVVHPEDGVSACEGGERSSRQHLLRQPL